MTRLVCVGTSDAFGSGGRRQSAYLVQRADGAGILLDCAGTTLTGLEALGIPRESIDVVAISHFHADHFGGLPLFLLASRYVDRRKRPLDVAGPPGIEERTREAARALGHPIRDDPSFPLRFHEIDPARELALGPWGLGSFACNHTPDSRPHGLVVRSGEHRVAYSGDTGWFDGLPTAVRGVDLFLCECTQRVGRYDYHLGLDVLEARRGEFEGTRVVLTHLGPEMRAAGSAGSFEVADDGLVIEL